MAQPQSEPASDQEQRRPASVGGVVDVIALRSLCVKHCTPLGGVSHTLLPRASCREGLQILYRIRRAKFLCELVVFVAFFVSFLLVVYEAYNVHNSWSQVCARHS